MSHAALLFLALLLDGLLGEPRWLWSRWTHPAILMGRAVGFMDTRLNTGAARKAKGIFAMAALGIGTWVLGHILSQLGGLVEAILAAMLLAQKSLAQHVNAVAQALRLSLHDGRLAVAQIVGRDVRGMDEPAVARAAIESAAENFSDGILAPAFWFLLGGLPGILLYKITNTADSMIGYRTERHEDFGWAAARFDDLLNLIPARLTALLVALLYGQMGLWADITKEARRHRSPNAGWPEAAVARVLGVALSGPRSYEGRMQDFPFVNPAGCKTPGPTDIERATRVTWTIWGAMLVLCCGLAGLNLLF